MNNYQTEKKLRQSTHFKDSSWVHYHPFLISNVTGAKDHSYYGREPCWVSDECLYTTVTLSEALTIAVTSAHIKHLEQSLAPLDVKF